MPVRHTLPARRLSVAPMLDWTDRHYRYMARQISRHVWLYTEMIHAGAIIHGQAERFLGKDESENPVALQLGGSNPADLAKAAAISGIRGRNPRKPIPYKGPTGENLQTRSIRFTRNPPRRE